MRTTAFVVIVSSFLLLLTRLLTNGLNLDAVRYDRQLRALDQFSQFERALNREVLTARAGLSRNYDALAGTTDAYEGSLNRLREAVDSDPEESAAIEVLAARARRQQDLIEQFKSRNALLQNSFAYFGLFSARLAASDHMPVVAAATTLEAAMLHLTLDTSPAAVREVQDRLQQLARLQRPPSDADSIQAALGHGGLLHDLLPATDALLKELMAAASSPEQDVVHSLILKRQLSARMSADRYRLLLYATSLMLLCTLVYLGLQVRARAIALRRRAAFEHVIAGISMRFINANPQNVDDEIERALAVTAACIGSDRAYLVLRGAVPRLHVWCKAGMSFSPGWPERAPALAAQLGPALDGIVHVPRVNRLPPGENRDACVAVGLGGWACVTHVDKDGTSVTLGFDSIGRPCSITAPGELSLLRMALDTVAYAVGRQSFERERARLEMRLQQARRMETVGTFTSGIAHNFNNILGGILGHTEMVEEHLSSDSRPRRNLDAIRQGAERARELVDQILTFGRRGEGRRERICIKALVAETNTLLAASLPSHVGLTVSETSEMTVVSAEPAQVQQVILNVCNNAAQAMDKPGVIEIQIGVREITEELRVILGLAPVASWSFRFRTPDPAWTKQRKSGFSSHFLRLVPMATVSGSRRFVRLFKNTTEPWRY
jgi:hypothetical protein